MQAYGVREVERLLQMSRGAILGLVRAGFVSPTRGPRREYRFSFQDLIVLRAARALTAAQVPARRITRSLRQLRSHLPSEAPLSGLSIRAVGDQVVVQEGHARWRADSGQYLLELDVSVADGELNMLARGTPSTQSDAAEEWFSRGWSLEDKSPAKARDAYARALELEPGHANAAINLGRLLHQSGDLAHAEQVYREALRRSSHNALLWFNLGVLLEDMDRRKQAAEAYEAGLREDPGFADCHYNLALAYEALGDARRAIRHMSEYRKLAREAGEQAED
jgi:tetratricopeptide (TPR) repeat protein